MITRLLICITLTMFSFSIYSQMFLNYSKERIIKIFDLDSNSVNIDSSYWSFQIDSLNSGTAKFYFIDNSCSEYQFELSCKQCYDHYVFSFTDDFYSDWLRINDSVYYYKYGKIGMNKADNQNKEYIIPTMTFRENNSTEKCLTIYFSRKNIEKELFNQLVPKPPKIKINKKKLSGSWIIQRNDQYPTDIDTITFTSKKYLDITFKDTTIYGYRITWYSSNTCLFWQYFEEVDDTEIYLTCEIINLTDSILEVWFYNEEEKFHQYFKRINSK